MPIGSNLSKSLIYFIEGLPGTGKSTLLNSLPNTFKKIPEVLNPEKLAKKHNKPNQDFFLRNDENKIRLAIDSNQTTFIERGPLSTLFFNMAKKTLNPRHNFEYIEQWYKANFEPIFKSNGQFRFIFLDIDPETIFRRKKRDVDSKDPWANPDSLEQIRNEFLSFAKRNPKISIIVDSRLPKKDILKNVLQFVYGKH